MGGDLFSANSRFSFRLSDSADNVLEGKGKFEEIVVSSKEIAASTAQLVHYS